MDGNAADMHKNDTPAVPVMDENGEYIIPLLSGHIGGAAALVDEISKISGAVPVHTIATDVQKKFAVDVFAKRNGMYISDRKRAKEISSAVLRGETIGFYVEEKEYAIKGNIPSDISMCDTLEELGEYGWGIVITDHRNKKAGDDSGVSGSCLKYRSEKG